MLEDELEEALLARPLDDLIAEVVVVLQRLRRARQVSKPAIARAFDPHEGNTFGRVELEKFSLAQVIVAVRQGIARTDDR